MNPLDHLKDIHLPAPINWWPPAPGWWLLGCLVLMLLFWSIKNLLRIYRQGRYRRLAIAKLQQHWQQYQQQHDSKRLLENVLHVIRQTAKSVGLMHHETALAALSSEQLFKEIDTASSGQLLIDIPIDKLTALLYQTEPSELETQQAQSLLDCARKWLKKTVVAPC